MCGLSDFWGWVVESQREAWQSGRGGLVCKAKLKGCERTRQVRSCRRASRDREWAGLVDRLASRFDGRISRAHLEYSVPVNSMWSSRSLRTALVAKKYIAMSELSLSYRYYC
jgi:hypothetical protein